MSEHHSKFRRSVIAILTAASIAAFTGCAQEPERTQTVAKTPEIIWSNGNPSTELDSNQWVKAVRDYQIAWSLARNLHDFSITQLTNTTLPPFIETGYQSDRSTVRHAEDGTLHDLSAEPGPLPFTPISVTEAPDGASAEVVICSVRAGWTLTRSGKTPPVDLTKARQGGYTMILGDDGKIRYKTGWGSTKKCDPSNIRFGYFDPPPTIPNALTEEDITPPIHKNATRNK